MKKIKIILEHICNFFFPFCVQLNLKYKKIMFVVFKTSKIYLSYQPLLADQGSETICLLQAYV